MIDCPTLVFKRSQMAGSPEHACPRPGERGGARAPFHGMEVNKFEGLVKCKVLPPRGLHILLLPSHINKKLMFVLCRKCAETENQSICSHSVGDRSLSGTWVSFELQKAVQIGYTLLKVYEVWQYDTISMYDPSTGDGGLFAQYMNTFMKISMIRTKKKQAH